MKASDRCSVALSHIFGNTNMPFEKKIKLNLNIELNAKCITPNLPHDQLCLFSTFDFFHRIL
jgi:hypothetical protein